MERHLDECAECRRVLYAWAWTSKNRLQASDHLGPEPAAERPERVGRFAIVDEIGAGAMGVVYRATDPELDRDVAIKLVRPDRDDREGRERLIREARAMARLTHGNVARIYEAGATGDQVYVAMELISGETLGDWLAEPRPWRRVVEVFAAAGRGLAAAHEAGLVHRDFKPDNVMIADDGRVVVMDFGLVADGHPSEAIEATDQQEPALRLTQTGARMGTPLFMSPEQHRAEPAGPASDQFSFCASLYLALYGAPPFAGDSWTELAIATTAGEVGPPPGDVAVPRWLRDAVLRGLEPEIGDRHPSMEALCAILERDRRRWILPAVAVTAVGAAAVAGALLVTGGGDAPGPSCGDFGDRLTGVWDDGRAAEVRASFVGSGKPYAADTAERVTEMLADYAERWREMRAEVCEATWVRMDRSSELHDRQVRCLDRALYEVDGLVDAFIANGGTVGKAVEAVSGLRPLDRCGDLEGLMRPDPLPVDPEQRARIDEIDRGFAALRARSRAGDLEDARAAAEGLVARAESAAYPPALAETLGLLGDLQQRLGDLDAAVATLHRAAAAAEAAGDPALRARSWIEIAGIRGGKQGKFDEARLWADYARAAAQSSGDPEVSGLMHHVLGVIAKNRGDYPEALEHYRAAVEIRRGLSDELDLALSLNNLAILYGVLEKLDESAAMHAEALAIKRRRLGPGHPSVAVSLLNAGLIDRRAGRFAAARDKFAEARKVLEATLPAGHTAIATARANLGLALGDLGEIEKGLAELAAAEAAYRARLGDSHGKVAAVVDHQGLLLARAGRHAEALVKHRAAMAIAGAALGPDHPEVANYVSNAGNAELALGRPAAAIALFRRSLEIRAAKLGAEHVDLAHDLVGLGSAELERGRRGPAVAYLERGLALAKRADDKEVLAAIEFALARALGGKPRAAELAESARSIYAGLEGDHRRDIAAVDAWLDGNR